VVVAAHLGLPRAEVQRAIADGRVVVDGEPRPKSFRLAGGERVQADVGAKPLEPEAGDLDIRFQDDRLAVLSKPAGLVVHPTAARRTGTLVNRLLAAGVPLAPAGGPERPGIVHRLDAGTSGLMVVAKDDETYLALQAMFRAHSVERVYLALVRGRVLHERFRVDAPLARNRARIQVESMAGKVAVTEVAVRERLPRSTLLEARPRTGRTHQIRVHLAAAGFPVLGDGKYGGGGDDAARLGLTRPFLHSWRMEFEHPLSGERVDFEEPLPADLEEALHRARHD
jgi:23S rRNA pseudouridine1911/1915/1917 synthase